MEATLIETPEQATAATPGIYVVRSGSDAYFLLMGFIEAGYAEFLGEFYNARGDSEKHEGGSSQF